MSKFIERKREGYINEVVLINKCILTRVLNFLKFVENIFLKNNYLASPISHTIVKVYEIMK